MKLFLAIICIASATLIWFGSGCSTTQGQKFASAVSTYNKDVAIIAADESKVETTGSAFLIQTTGAVPPKVTNATTYANAIVKDAQAAGQLFSGIVALFPPAITTGS